MNVVIVDRPSGGLELFADVCRMRASVRTFRFFSQEAEALAYAQKNKVDVLVTDVGEESGPGGPAGICLIRQLRERYRDMIVICVTAQTGYAQTLMFDCRADVLIRKPCDMEAVNRAVDTAELLSKRIRPYVEVRTFGRFDIFVNGNVVLFGNRKAKELLALCVDREGGIVRMEEAVDKLWPDHPYDDNAKRLYRKAVFSLNKTLKNWGGVEGVFCSKYGKCYVNKDMFYCDYYEWIRRPNEQNRYRGEYMFDYSWAEEKNAEIQNRMKKR